MGYGDEIMGSGMARGAAARDQRIAFGDGANIRWSTQAHLIYRGNPNVAPPGSESAADLQWVAHYKGSRAYIAGRSGDRWRFNPAFRTAPGELFFSSDELRAAERVAPSFVLIEPNVKRSAPNKQWPRERYQEVADLLRRDGIRVAQFATGPLLRGVEPMATHDFRDALALLTRAALYIGPEGGLHHGAAALGVPAVVIFGGFISPQITGYQRHVNLFTGDDLGCGRTAPCAHCRAAMDRISVAHVLDAARGVLR